MKFDRLQASISNNANESPSLYMALCLIESLFADMEKACGSELSACPIGDERFPTKLVWLCRSINSIYTHNDASLQRNRARLDDVMKKLSATHSDLEDLSGVAQELEARQAEYDRLRQQLAQGSDAAEQAKKLAGQCDQMKLQLEQLRQFDPQAAGEELKSLTAEASVLEGRRADLSAKLEQAARQAADLRQQVDALTAQYDRAEDDLERTDGLLAQKQKVCAGLSAELEQKQAALDALEQEYQTLAQRHGSSDEALTRARRQVAELEDQKASFSTLLTHTNEQAAELQQQIQTLTAQQNTAQDRLDEANGLLAQKQEACAALSRELEERNTALETLERERLALADHQAVSEEALAQAQQQIADLEAQKASLQAQLEQSDRLAAEVQRQTEALTAQWSEAQDQLLNLTDLLAQKQEAQDSLSTELEQKQADLEALTLEYQALTNDRSTTELALSEARQQVAAFREEELEPIQAQFTVVSQELQALGLKKSAIETEYAQAKALRSQLTLDVARQTEELNTLNVKLTGSREKLDALRQEQHRLSSELCKNLEEMEALQEAAGALETEKLPEARRLYELEQARYDELRQAAAHLEEQQTELQTQIAETEALLPKLKEDLQNDRVVYDGLTASYSASSKELESLERQIAELRSNNNDEKLEIYRKQLEDNQRQLEELIQECQRMETENALMQKRLDDGQGERARLMDLKRRHESGLEVTHRQLQELAFAESPEYIRELAALEEQARLLENVRTKLELSVSAMHKALGGSPVEAGATLEAKFLRDLQALRHHIGDLRSALLSCAESLKLEER